MGPTDARRLSAESLADLRRRVVAAVDGGMTQIEAARVFGVSRRAVGVWVRAHRAAGEAAFRPGRRGRAPGDQFALDLPAQARTLAAMAAGPPDAAGPGDSLWSRRSVAALVERECGLRLSPTTVGGYLARWGLVADGLLPPRGLDPLARTGWAGRPRGRETMWAAWTRPAPGCLGGVLLAGSGGGEAEVLIAANSRGSAAFLLRHGPYSLEDALDFGERLVRHTGHGVHLVVRGWPAQHAGVLRHWADAVPPDGPVRVSAY